MSHANCDQYIFFFLSVFLTLFRVIEEKKDEQKQKGEHTSQCKLDNAPFSLSLSRILFFTFHIYT